MRVLILAGSGSYEDNRKFLPRNWEVDVDLSVARRRFHDPFRRLIGCLLQTIKVLPRLHRYDVVLSTGTMNGMFLSLLQSLFRLRKPCHVMIDIALPRFVSPRRKFFLFISKIVFSSVRRVICFASKQANFWNFILGLKDRAIFVPFGTDEKSSHLNNLNNLTLSNYIFSAGAAARDYKTLIKAIEGVNINLLIVAGRDPMTGKIALPSTLPPNVRLKVEIPKEEYKRLLAKSRFVIVPLKDVPFVCGQSVILDAMSMGKAVIATRGVSTIDYIVDGETGLLVEAGDVESLKAKILFLLENPLKAKEIGENAKRAVQIYFNQRLMQKKIGMIVENAYISTNINCKSSKCDKFRHC